MAELNDQRLAVLVDADNISYTHIKDIMEEVARYGTPTFKRLYGDLTKPSLAGWKQVLLEHAIIPVLQYGYTTGKNSTDTAMIIDAMDILYSGRVDGFCIVSSDSDFTRLAVRLREAGMMVIGIGERKTPGPFIAACEKFIYIEAIRSANKKTQPVEEAISDKQRRELIEQITAAITDLEDDNGWAFLGEVGTLLLKKRPDFDPRNFGFSKLTPLVKSLDSFDLDERETNKGKGRIIYIRNRERG